MPHMYVRRTGVQIHIVYTTHTILFIRLECQVFQCLVGRQEEDEEVIFFLCSGVSRFILCYLF